MITKIKGVALTPGISANNRFYSPEAIRSAVTQAQPRVASGALLMKAHHGAPDVLGYVGRITSLQVGEGGQAEFEAELGDTSTARDVRRLIRGERPLINAVSIAGEWVGKMQTVKAAGREITTAPGLLLHSIDLTATPGVDQARFRVAESVTGSKRAIYEEAGYIVPVPDEPDALDYARMTHEEWTQAASSYGNNLIAASEERKRAAGRSPFWRGYGEETI